MTFTASSWTLQDILTEYRAIAGVPDIAMQSDADAVQLINWYYQYVLPKELKIFWGYTYYNFFTTQGVDKYVAPVNFQTLNPSVTADGFPIEWYSDPDTFWSDWPLQINKVVVGNGDGMTNSFTFQIPAFPVLPWSLYVTDGTQVAQDNGNGGFFNAIGGGSLPGSVNYQSGVVSGLAFPVPPAANTNITESSSTYFANRPQAILFFKNGPLLNATVAAVDAVNMFVLRPVPDQTYKITMQGIQVPSPMVNYTDVPFRIDLGPLIALGAALHRFKRLDQMDQYDQYLPEYNRFKDVCMQDTYEVYLYQRSVPAF